MGRHRYIQGINCILLPVMFYDTILEKIMKDNPTLKTKCEDLWHTIRKRGVYLLNNIKGEEICYPITQEELKWIKEIYESVI